MIYTSPEKTAISKWFIQMFVFLIMVLAAFCIAIFVIAKITAMV